MNLKPLGDKIIVEPIAEVSKSGFVMPETMDKEKPQEGTVLAVGEGKINDKGEHSPMHVQVGDKVFFRKYAPDEFEHDGKTILVMSESDVIAIIKE
ncbi:MAG TPA: co-chaperone GroES [bacterium]|nr:co-chaperone GroES [bacterium]